MASLLRRSSIKPEWEYAKYLIWAFSFMVQVSRVLSSLHTPQIFGLRLHYFIFICIFVGF